MTPPTIQFARAARDGGIHALAALDHALAVALDGLPADHGLSNDQLRDLKRVFGGVMAEIVGTIINPATQAFPGLEPSQATWSAAIVEQTRQVGQQAARTLENASTEPLLASQNDKGKMNG